jgi:hypothetical protein
MAQATGITYALLEPFLPEELRWSREEGFQVEVELKYEGVYRTAPEDLGAASAGRKDAIPPRFPL